jgi:hypothetical protein
VLQSHPGWLENNKSRLVARVTLTSAQKNELKESIKNINKINEEASLRVQNTINSFDGLQHGHHDNGTKFSLFVRTETNAGELFQHANSV